MNVTEMAIVWNALIILFKKESYGKEVDSIWNEG